MPYANNEGADQLAHPRSLISTFVVRCLDRKMPLLAISKNVRLWLASEDEQAGLSLNWSQTPKAGFLVPRLVWSCIVFKTRMKMPVTRDKNDRSQLIRGTARK